MIQRTQISLYLSRETPSPPPGNQRQFSPGRDPQRRSPSSKTADESTPAPQSAQAPVMLSAAKMVSMCTRVLRLPTKSYLPLAPLSPGQTGTCRRARGGLGGVQEGRRGRGRHGDDHGQRAPLARPRRVAGPRRLVEGPRVRGREGEVRRRRRGGRRRRVGGGGLEAGGVWGGRARRGVPARC